MAESSRLELLLLAKDKLSPTIKRLLGLLKQTEKEGAASGKSLDNLNKKLSQSAKGDGLKKTNAEIKKTTVETEKAAKAQEKLNNARKKKTSDGTTAKEAADKTKLAGATEKAAKAEEKLNNARKRGAGGRRNKSQNGIEDDLVQGGTGAAGLWVSKQGINAAMTKQEAMTDLYTSFYRSSLSAAELNSQMREGEKIADRLGIKLPGTTSDFLQLFATMKQNGIEANVILAGAGEAAANLAVANKEDFQEVGANLARFGQIFHLKTRDEYLSAADLMSRTNTTYKINSSELMEAVKDFSGRTGKGLGLEGGRGAEDTLQYLSFLRTTTAMKGLSVGTAASSFFNQYTQAKEKKKDPTKELKKLTGVKLNIFDEKGKFLGLENAVKEFAKLKGKLSDEQMVSFGNKLAGEEGAAVFQSMVKEGDQWDTHKKKLAESMELTAKVAEQSKVLSNKLEALGGSLQALGASAFGPLLGPLGELSDGANDLTGYLTKLATAYPTTAATTAGVLSLGTAFLTFKAGSGLVSKFLGGANSQIIAVGDNATASATKFGKLKNALSVGNVFKILLLAETIGFTWEQFENARKWSAEADKATKGKNEAINSTAKVTSNALNDPNTSKEDKNKISKGSAEVSLFSLRSSGLLQEMRAESPKGFGDMLALLDRRLTGKSTQTGYWANYDRNKGAARFQSEAPSLELPSVMREFLKLLPEKFPGNDEKSVIAREELKQTAALAYPESYIQAMKELSGLKFGGLADSFFNLSQQANTNNQNLNQQSQMTISSIAGLQQPTSTLVDQLFGLNTNSNSATSAVGNLATSVSNAATRINSVEIKPPTFGTINIPGIANPNPITNPFGRTNYFGKARGGSVTKDHTYRINEIGQEFFTPSASGSVVSNDILRKRNESASSAQSFTFNIPITVGASDNAKETALQVRREIAAILSEFKEEMTPRMTAKKVYAEIDRDVGRS